MMHHGLGSKDHSFLLFLTIAAMQGHVSTRQAVRRARGGHVNCFVFYVQKAGLGPIKPVWVNIKTGGISVGLPGKSFLLNINN
jgi:hypothetical protein